MDVNGFREPQSPWFFTQPPEYLVETRAKAADTPSKSTPPTPDNRYPGYAAPMQDARIFTDYRPNCATNIPTGQQYAARQWLQNNATQIIGISRTRQATQAGAGRSYDARIEAPPRAYVKCDTAQCTYMKGSPDGIGVVRKEAVPSLFGTFAESAPFMGKREDPGVTTYEEGGRNTRRGF